MKKILLSLIAATAMTGCISTKGGGHFLSDAAYRTQVEQDFAKRRELATGRDSLLFNVFEQDLNTEQKEALEFLYAYMPLCDLADYDGEFFLRQVNGAFRARDHFDWGKTIPEDVFRHFVLVHRVNNEYLDEARDVFFEELKDRIKGMSMRDAALEVNHWCHEKVTYRGTDIRTSAALATVRTSWGRCGEQSTFTTAALRAVGIPARQCYTPRWVHTDSNHAWVEVWIDGTWHYMGACEPEPELDVAWFDGPVQRAMMVHTTAYGRYTGAEEKTLETPLYSVLNVLPNYAATRRVEVQTAPNAQVQFLVYNGAELYPIATLTADAEGRTGITTGKGDLMIWASVDGFYGYTKCGAGDVMVNVEIGQAQAASEGKVSIYGGANGVEELDYTEEFTMAAPAEQPFKELPAELIAQNAVRLAREDSIRNAYMATFADSALVAKVAAETSLDSRFVSGWLVGAQGNWREIESFVRAQSANASLPQFMSSLSAKDLRDAPASVLADLIPTPARIGTELLTPWKSYFNALELPRTGAEIERYVAKNVRISDADNYYDCRLSPRGVHELKVADRLSRDIYFVALCRTAGVTARLNPATGEPEWSESGNWHGARFETGDAVAVAEAAKAAGLLNNAALTVRFDPANLVKPLYGTHFTIARLEDGTFRGMELWGRFGANGGTVELPRGYYRVMSASRANDGSATVKAQYIDLDGDRSVEVSLPKLEGLLFVKGVVDMNSIIMTEGGEKTTLKALSKGKGAVVIFADPDKEPTKHILQEMPGASAALEAWGGAVLFMVPDDKRTEAFSPTRLSGLPAQTVWGIDTGRALLNAASDALQLGFRNNFPLALYLTNNGGVLFTSEGYRIGIPDDLLLTIKLEQETK